MLLRLALSLVIAFGSFAGRLCPCACAGHAHHEATHDDDGNDSPTHHPHDCPCKKLQQKPMVTPSRSVDLPSYVNVIIEFQSDCLVKNIASPVHTFVNHDIPIPIPIYLSHHSIQI